MSDTSKRRRSKENRKWDAVDKDLRPLRKAYAKKLLNVARKHGIHHGQQAKSAMFNLLAFDPLDFMFEQLGEKPCPKR